MLDTLERDCNVGSLAPAPVISASSFLAEARAIASCGARGLLALRSHTSEHSDSAVPLPHPGKQLSEALAIFDRFVAENGSPTRHLFSSFLPLGFEENVDGEAFPFLAPLMAYHALRVGRLMSAAQSTSPLT